MKTIVFLSTVIMSIFTTSPLYANTAIAEPDSINEESQDTTALMLDEVVVVANKNIVKVDGSRMKISISGTPYSSLGSAIQLMENLPGMMPGASGPTVIGKGLPTYYIDGREVKELSELQTLQSSDIKTIEIERNPGVEYGAYTNSVVLITTKKSIRDFLFLGVGAMGALQRHLSGAAYFTSRFKKNSFSSSLTYRYAVVTTENRETYTRDIFHNDAPPFTLTQHRNLPHHQWVHNLNYIAEWRINRSNLLGLYYNFMHLKHRSWANGINAETDNSITTDWQYNARGTSNSNTHNATLMYTLWTKPVTFRLSQDVYIKSTNGDNSSTELNPTQEVDLNTNTHPDNYAYTTRLDMWFLTLPWQLNGKAGIRYDHVDSETESLYTYPGAEYLSNMTVNEDNANAYVSISRTFGKVTILPQLNYSYTYRHIATTSSSTDAPSIVNQRYSLLNPRIDIRWDVSKELSLRGRYSRSVTQPGFKALNSGIIYESQWEIKDSNPELKNSTTDEGQVGLSFQGFSFDLSYFYIKDDITSWQSVYNEEANMVSEYSVNLPHYQLWRAVLSYSGRIGKVGFYAALEGSLPRYKMMEREKSYVCNNPSFSINANLNYTLNKLFSFTSSFTYQGRHYNIPFTMQHSWINWNIGVTASLLNNSLSINLQATDILNKADYSRNSSWYNNIHQITNGSSDSRGLILNISYIIFSKPISLSTTNANHEIKNRLDY